MGGDIKGRIHMKTIAKILFVTVAFGAMASFSGCTKKEKTVAGVLIGAGAGAGIGAAVGNGGGAAAGAVIGGVTGGVIGHEMGDDKDDRGDK